MELFWHAFIPLFVALDGVGLLPLFWALAQRLDASHRRRAVSEAVLTASAVALSFLLAIHVVFELMGLKLSDIMVAGGLILIALCLKDLLLAPALPDGAEGNPGVVPLGVPLLAGPAVLATLLLVRDQYGWPVTLVAFAANMALVWLILRGAAALMRWLGRHGALVISKVSSLILTAFGVMLIRRGLGMAMGAFE
jgi:multiple antibiotic resistance protein